LNAYYGYKPSVYNKCVFEYDNYIIEKKMDLIEFIACNVEKEDLHIIGGK